MRSLKWCTDIVPLGHCVQVRCPPPATVNAATRPDSKDLLLHDIFKLGQIWVYCFNVWCFWFSTLVWSACIIPGSFTPQWIFPSGIGQVFFSLRLSSFQPKDLICPIELKASFIRFFFENLVHGIFSLLNLLETDKAILRHTNPNSFYHFVLKVWISS